MAETTTGHLQMHVYCVHLGSSHPNYLATQILHFQVVQSFGAKLHPMLFCFALIAQMATCVVVARQYSLQRLNYFQGGSFSN